jgi:hypothetical protein
MSVYSILNALNKLPVTPRFHAVPANKSYHIPRAMSSYERNQLIDATSTFSRRFGTCSLAHLVMASLLGSKKVARTCCHIEMLKMESVQSALHQFASWFGVEGTAEEILTRSITRGDVHRLEEEVISKVIELMWHNIELFEEVDAMLCAKQSTKRAWWRRLIAQIKIVSPKEESSVMVGKKSV